MEAAKFIVWSDVHVDVTDNMYTTVDALQGRHLDKALLLAGDVADFSDDGEHISLFLSKCAEQFDHVFYTPGNHERWGARSDDDIQDIVFEACARSTRGNITLLNRDYARYKGSIVVGATLWTDYMGMNPLALDTVRIVMRCDFDEMKTTPEALYAKHLQDKGYIYETLLRFKDMPVAVMTHHSCCGKSVGETYNQPHYTYSNSAYYTELSDDILRLCDMRSQPMVWVHGHMHSTSLYEIGDTCRVIANPYGYSKFQSDFHEDIGFTFEVT